jgi:hypothetical protein
MGGSPAPRPKVQSANHSLSGSQKRGTELDISVPCTKEQPAAVQWGTRIANAHDAPLVRRGSVDRMRGELSAALTVLITHRRSSKRKQPSSTSSSSLNYRPTSHKGLVEGLARGVYFLSPRQYYCQLFFCSTQACPSSRSRPLPGRLPPVDNPRIPPCCQLVRI